MSKLHTVLRWLKKNRNHGLTSRYATNELGDIRLSDTIMRLRDKGYKIDMVRVHTTNRYGKRVYHGEYFLRGTEEKIKCD